MLPVDFIFDFASPNAYLVHRLIGGIETRTGAKFKYIPCLLGGIFKATGNQAPMLANANIPAKLAYERLEFMRFIAAHGLTRFVFNPHFPVSSLLLMRGAIYAHRAGALADYIEAGLHHMWEAPKNMSDPEVFVAALTSSGFDGKAMFDATQDPDIKAGLAANTDSAVARGAFGIPTFFVGNEMFFGKERLGQVEDAIKVQGI
jgi:2-hydroxychromene-2-carboxylate isomerase